MTADTGAPAVLPKLVASLDAIVALCDDLRSVLERERGALTQGKDDELAVALSEKRDRLRRIAEAEEIRRHVSEDLSETMGLGRVDTPLAEVASRLEIDEPTNKKANNKREKEV